MDIETIKAYCAAKKGVTSDFPFGDDTWVYRVMGKIFALIPLDASPRMNLKCDPAFAEILRQTYAAVTPGYHMNKKHWNTILVDDTIPDDEILEMIDHSYEVFAKGLTKAERGKLKAMPNG
jgi:predicted DNA-binding protein (MmcQ/YjbR family)